MNREIAVVSCLYCHSEHEIYRGYIGTFKCKNKVCPTIFVCKEDKTYRMEEYDINKHSNIINYSDDIVLENTLKLIKEELKEEQNKPAITIKINGELADKTVYFLYCEELNRIKIGITSDLDQRINQIQSCCPSKLELIATFWNCTSECEKRFHSKFEEDRLNGEWFIFSDKMKEFLYETWNMVNETRHFMHMICPTTFINGKKYSLDEGFCLDKTNVMDEFCKSKEVQEDKEMLKINLNALAWVFHRCDLSFIEPISENKINQIKNLIKDIIEEDTSNIIKYYDKNKQENN